MDVVTLLTAIGASGIVTGLFQWLTNRRINRAQANNSDADYVEKIIAQADKRVEQYEADAKNWRDKITETEAYAKEQHMQNKELRSEKDRIKDALHVAELTIKDLEYKRCTNDECKKRIPPRAYNKPQE